MSLKNSLSEDLNLLDMNRSPSTNLSLPGTPLNPSSGFFTFHSLNMARSKSSVKRDVFEQKNELGPRIVVVMVGLPARGKSYICKKLNRYLTWTGFNTRVFNVGNRRRVFASEDDVTPTTKEIEISLRVRRMDESILLNFPNAIPPSVSNGGVGQTGEKKTHDAKFFDHANVHAKLVREKLARDSLEELILWLNTGGGKVGILDATNTTVERRALLVDRVKKEKQMEIIFIESICTEGPVLDTNIEMKLSGPDYLNIPRELAIADFQERIANYQKVYETIGEEEEKKDLSYIKIINIGKKVITHNIHGYIASQCVFYLMQLNIKKRTIWLTRHGESMYNPENRIGGDPSLTERGHAYGVALGKFLVEYYSENRSSVTENESHLQSLESIRDDNFGTEGTLSSINVWTSCLKRTIETVESFDEKIFDIKHIRFLNEIYAGVFENMTYDEFEANNKEEFDARKSNKLTYRYPGAGGESYLDVIDRLRPLIIELERMTTDTFICTHNALMRTLVVYFLGLPLEKMPSLNIPLHCLYKVEPTPYGATLTKFRYNEETDLFDVEEGNSH